MENQALPYLALMNAPLILPLLTLLETLENTPLSPPTGGVQARWHENGPSAAIIVLTAVIFESTINGIRINEDANPKSEKKISSTAVQYFIEVCQDPNLGYDVREVFSVRNAIVHAHLWSGLITWNTEKNYEATFAKKPTLDRKKYGDPKFWNEALDPETLCSKRLGINLVPTCIWRRDAYLVLKTIKRALIALDSIYPCYQGNIGVSNIEYDFLGEKRHFYDIVTALPDLS